MAGIWNSSTTNYSTIAEQYNDACLNMMNHYMNWFFDIDRSNIYDKIDYQYTDIKGNEGVLESKVRSNKINDFDSIMIEKEKYEALKNVNCKNALYLNFFDNSYSKFWIVDIKKLPKDINFDWKKININMSHLYSDTYNDERGFIPAAFGKYYEYNWGEHKYYQYQFATTKNNKLFINYYKPNE